MSNSSAPAQNKKKSDPANLPFHLIDLGIEPTADGNLLEHLLRFGRLLRLMGVKVTLSQILELVRAFDVIQITNKRDFYFAARSLLMTRREDYILFDQAFALYWRLPEKFKIGSNNEKNKRPQKLARLPGLMVGMMGMSDADEEEQGSSSRRITQWLRSGDTKVLL